MSKTEALQDFTVYAKVVVSMDMTIRASSLTDAVERAKQLKDSDFIQARRGCGWNDTETFEITGILK